MRLLRSALPVDGVLVRDPERGEVLLGGSSRPPQATSSDPPTSGPLIIEPGRASSLGSRGESVSERRSSPGPSASAPAQDEAAGAPDSSSERQRTPSVRPSARPDSRAPAARVAALLSLPPPGFDGPAEDVTLPMEMPADFVVRDVDGTTRAQRPATRPPPPLAKRPERRSLPAERAAPRRPSRAFWFVVVVAGLVILFILARFAALGFFD